MTFEETIAGVVRVALTDRLKPIEECLIRLERAVNPLSSREVFTVKEAAEQLNLSAYQIRELLKSGKLAGTKDGSGRWRISKEELVRFANNGAKHITAEHAI